MTYTIVITEGNLIVKMSSNIQSGRGHSTLRSLEWDDASHNAEDLCAIDMLDD